MAGNYQLTAMIDYQQHTEEKVQNVALFKKAYKNLVQIIAQ